MLSNEEIFLRLFASALLGSMIGLERERLDRDAGLRTHMLVSVGSTVIMLVSAFGFGDVLGQPNVVLDPARVAAQVVSGIGFLGAGTIILRKEVVRGLTTAASLWAVASIGLSVGGGLYLAAVAATFVVLIILVGVKPIERRLFRNRRPRLVFLRVNRPEISLLTIESAIVETGLQLRNIQIEPGESDNEENLQLTLDPVAPEELILLIEKLRAISGVREIRHSDT